MTSPYETGPEDLRRRVQARRWYHTIELPGGVITPGRFDHRPVLDRYGIPARLDGQRVLDVATFDGFFAFEFERRGAQVVAADIDDRDHLDWPEPLRRRAPDDAFHPGDTGFHLAHEALGSNVEHAISSVYDLDPTDIGRFDLVFIGSLLVHLRDPVGALMAVQRVCHGRLHVVDAVDRWLDLVPWLSLARFTGTSDHLTWWLPNRQALGELVETAGFLDVEVGPRFRVPRRGEGGVPHGRVTARAG